MDLKFFGLPSRARPARLLKGIELVKLLVFAWQRSANEATYTTMIDILLLSCFRPSASAVGFELARPGNYGGSMIDDDIGRAMIQLASTPS